MQPGQRAICGIDGALTRITGALASALRVQVAKECEKHGPVVRCLIFEARSGPLPSSQAQPAHGLLCSALSHC